MSATNEYKCQIGEPQWGRIYKYLKEFKGIYVRQEQACRRFVEGVFWMARSGSQWRLLPKEYGDWNTVYRRFADWANKGIWYKMLYYFAQDADMEYIMVDSTILRAHACATPKKNAQQSEGLGRSCGGFSTKVHGLCDALGNPLDFRISAGQEHDAVWAQEIFRGKKPESLILSQIANGIPPKTRHNIYYAKYLKATCRQGRRN